jgi:dephospho-CoA kinase
VSSRWASKIVVGLTGNIATGKTAVMRLAAERGALTLDADQIVHEILQADAQVQTAVTVAFGDGVRRPDGSIDRAALGAVVFSDPNALRKLETLVHPAVGREVDRRINESSAEVVVIEAIKLLEGSLAAHCDQIWVADCTRRRQIERLTICRGMNEEAAIHRVDAQNPQSAKVARADVVIDTNGTLADTHRQFELAWSSLVHSSLGVR